MWLVFRVKGSFESFDIFDEVVAFFERLYFVCIVCCTGINVQCVLYSTDYICTVYTVQYRLHMYSAHCTVQTTYV